MRYACIAQSLAAIVILSMPATAFEVEEKKLYASSSETRRLKVISTADINVFEPIILAFQRENRNVAIDYVVASSSEVMRAIYDENAPFDLAISSAMDLQTKLANDGFAQDYRSDATAKLPTWAQWHNQIFAFTLEPALLVISKAAFQGLQVPATREELVALLRDNPKVFDGRIGTYDVRKSGAGYLFATQESRNTETFWRLTEVMGRLNARLYCCSSSMIDDVANGKLAIAYNVLGSYAQLRVNDDSELQIVPMQDFVTVMLRTAIIPKTNINQQDAGAMIDFLTSLQSGSDLARQTGLPPINGAKAEADKAMRPIRLGPGLLVFLDSQKRENFIRNWESSITQR